MAASQSTKKRKPAPPAGAGKAAATHPTRRSTKRSSTSAGKPAGKPGSKSTAAKPATKAAKPAAKPASKPAATSTSKPASKSVSKAHASAKTAAKSATSPKAAKSTPKPARAASEPASGGKRSKPAAKAPTAKAPTAKAPAAKAPSKTSKSPTKPTKPSKPSAPDQTPMTKATIRTSTPASIAHADGQLPKPKFNKEGLGYTRDFDLPFIKAQYEMLQQERIHLTGQAMRLEAEAHQLVEEAEMGDVQFDDEGGEGDTMVVERERDLALSAQALDAVAEIDAALARMMRGTYGYSVISGRPIPKERLEAIPWSSVLVEEKVGGIGRR